MKKGVCGKKLKENRSLRWTMGSCSAAGSYFFSSGCRRYIGVDGGLEKVSRYNVGDVVTNVLMHVKGREGVSGCRRDHHVVSEDMINVTLRS